MSFCCCFSFPPKKEEKIIMLSNDPKKNILQTYSFDACVRGVCFAPNDKVCAIHDDSGHISIFDLESSSLSTKPICKFSGQKSNYDAVVVANRQHCMLFTQDSNYFICGGPQHKLEVHDCSATSKENFQKIAELPSISSDLQQYIWAPNYRYLAAISYGTIALYDFDNPEKPVEVWKKKCSHSLYTIAFHYSGEYLYSGAYSNAEIDIIDAKNGGEKRTFALPGRGYCTAICASTLSSSCSGRPFYVCSQIEGMISVFACDDEETPLYTFYRTENEKDRGIPVNMKLLRNSVLVVTYHDGDLCTFQLENNSKKATLVFRSEQLEDYHDKTSALAIDVSEKTGRVLWGGDDRKCHLLRSVAPLWDIRKIILLARTHAKNGTNWDRCFSVYNVMYTTAKFISYYHAT